MLRQSWCFQICSVKRRKRKVSAAPKVSASNAAICKTTCHFIFSWLFEQFYMRDKLILIQSLHLSHSTSQSNWGFVNMFGRGVFGKQVPVLLSAHMHHLALFALGNSLYFHNMDMRSSAAGMLQAEKQVCCRACLTRGLQVQRCLNQHIMSKLQGCMSDWF